MDIKEIFENLPFINVSEFSRLTDINPALMRRYTCGEISPSDKQKKKIIHGLSQVIDHVKEQIANLSS